MKHFIPIAVALAAFAAAPLHAAWYWPFGDDEDSPDKPPRLHRLLENANDLIEAADHCLYEIKHARPPRK